MLKNNEKMNCQPLNKSSVVFEPQTHQYINDDWKTLLGVTTLMKKHGLSPDYSDVNPEILRKAAARGTKVHNDIEAYCKGEPVEHSDALKAFAGLKLDVLDNEYLVSDNEIVASSIDIVLKDYCLVDIKTTSVLHLSPLRWQLSIYAYLFELQNPTLKASKLFGLHIKNGIAQMVEVSRIESSEIERLIQCERDGQTFIPSLEPVSVDDQIAKLYDIEKLICDLETQTKVHKEMRTKLHEALYDQMEKENIKKQETDKMTITRVLPTIRSAVDATKLKGDYPEVYAQVVKQSEVKGSIKITLKTK